MKMKSRHLLPRAGMLGLLAVIGVAVGVPVGAGGCGPGFDPYNRLSSLRVLAIRSEPVAPTTGETTTIDTKVYVPINQSLDATDYYWSWCPFSTTAGADCPITEDQASALAGMPISYQLATSATGTTSFTNAIPPAIFTMLCAGTPGVPAPDCTDGFPIQLKLTIVGRRADGTEAERVQAVRPLRLRFRDTDQPNLNPTVSGLYALIDGTAQPFDTMPPPILPRHVKTVIGVDVPDADSESYNGKDDNGDPAFIRERLNVSWFVETGDTDHQRTSFIDGQVTLAAASTVKWTPIRDDREGAGWTEGSVSLETTP
jgi:hypothetical protein